jgi:hypothetical protein
MQIKRTRNALVGSLVISIARRSVRRRLGGGSSGPAWPFFIFGVMTVFGVVVWRRRNACPAVGADELFTR